MMLGSCSKFPKSSTIICPEGPAKGSKQCPYLPPIPQVPRCLLGHVSQMVEQPARQSGPVEELSPVSDPTQN